MAQQSESRAVAKPQRSEAMARFRQEIELRNESLKNLLPKHLPLEKFKAMVFAATSMNPELLDCTPHSLIKASIEASELGLSLNPVLGECDILPVWDSRVGGKVAQCRPRYGGLMKLARQSGEISMIEARVVHEGDEFAYEYGLDPKLRHLPKASTSPVTHAYCIWRLANGERNFEVMDIDQIKSIMNRSSAKKRDGTIVGPWVTDFDEMARKTAVRRASKYMPRSAEAFARAVAVDNLHEAGHDIEIKDGEVFDVTEDAPADGPREEVVRDRQQQQAAALEQRLAMKPGPITDVREEEPAVVQPPAAQAPRQARAPAPLAMPLTEDGHADYGAYEREAAEEIKAMPAKRRKDWLALNADALDELQFHAPDIVRRLQALAG